MSRGKAASTIGQPKHPNETRSRACHTRHMGQREITRDVPASDLYKSTQVATATGAPVSAEATTIPPEPASPQSARCPENIDGDVDVLAVRLGGRSQAGAGGEKVRFAV